MRARGLFLAVAATFALSCGIDEPEWGSGARGKADDVRDTTDDPKIDALGKKSRDFALDLYRAAAAGDGEGEADAPDNLVLHPAPLFNSWLTIKIAAGEETLEEIEAMLGFGDDEEQLDSDAQQFAQFALVYTHWAGAFETAGALKIMNQAHLDYAIKEKGEDYFQMALDRLRKVINWSDFKQKSEESRKKINTAIKDDFGFEEFFPEKSIDENTALAIASGMVMSANWAGSFGKPQVADFTVDDDASAKVWTITQAGELRLAQDLEAGDAKFTMVEVPLEGGRVVMDLLVPAEADGLSDLEEALDGEGFDQWLGQLKSQKKAAVTLPLFEIKAEGSKDLRPLFKKKMGVTKLFEERPNFMGVVPENERKGFDASIFPSLELQHFYHQAKIEIAHDGINENSSFTGEVVETADHEKVEALRPFVFIVRDRATGSIFQIGRLVDPDKAQPDGGTYDARLDEIELKMEKPERKDGKVTISGEICNNGDATTPDDLELVISVSIGVGDAAPEAGKAHDPIKELDKGCEDWKLVFDEKEDLLAGTFYVDAKLRGGFSDAHEARKTLTIPAPDSPTDKPSGPSDKDGKADLRIEDITPKGSDGGKKLDLAIELCNDGVATKSIVEIAVFERDEKPVCGETVDKCKGESEAACKPLVTWRVKAGFEGDGHCDTYKTTSPLSVSMKKTIWIVADAKCEEAEKGDTAEYNGDNNYRDLKPRTSSSTSERDTSERDTSERDTSERDRERDPDRTSGSGSRGGGTLGGPEDVEAAGGGCQLEPGVVGPSPLMLLLGLLLVVRRRRHP